MIFSSLLFLYIFLPALLVLYYVVKNNAYRRIILLAFSLVFYAWGEPVCIFLLLGVTLVAYIAGRLIGKTEEAKKRKIFAGVGIVLILAALVFFKYTVFAVETVNSIGIFSLPVPKIALPIGISFFSFQAISYVADVIRKDAQPQTSYAKLLLYISLFPQLIAGPIVRYKDIEMQLDNRSVDIAKINDGIWRFAVGLGKKVIIANSCGAAAEALYGLENEITLAARWMGVVFFGFQLYYDFSGYSDMAIGLGKMFGFEFMENFRHPFASRSATEYWRRWHISLSSFFRDYVYIPLGGNRRMHIRNIFVVWLLTGMWHGASWNFILWGLYYGILITLEKYVFFPLCKKLPKLVHTVIFEVYFIFITLFGMALFYFDGSLGANLGYLFGAGIDSFTDIYTNSIIQQNVILLLVAAVFSVPTASKLFGLAVAGKENSDTVYVAQRVAKLVAAIAIIAVSTALIAGSSYNPFLYFRF